MNDAMSGLATGAKGNKREQDILTPQNVVDFVTTMFGHSIVLDPCASRDKRSVVDATFRYYGVAADSANGLEYGWTNYTYANPPYAHLKSWLPYAAVMGSGGRSVAMLCPTRPNRVWWHESRNTCSLALDLGPIYFIGYVDSKGRKASFPAPLSLLFWNVEASDAEVHRHAHEVGLPVVNVDRPAFVQRLLQESIQRAA